MINREQAITLAMAWLADHRADGGTEGPLELSLVEDETIEVNFGWVIFYTSKLYRSTGEVRYAIAGNAPLIVDRADGSLHLTGTAQPIDYYVEQYRSKWREQPRFPCPCCGHHTLDEEPPGTFVICPVCLWEDDPVQFHDHDYAGGANVESLNQARQNFRVFGASGKNALRYVRPPRPEEMP